MMSEARRYSDDEMAAIFEAAATEPGATEHSPRRDGAVSASSSGFTLAELQSIGGEAGIPPARIADAAAALELGRGTVARASSLGMPTAVGRTLELPRAMTDREWEILLGELRDTFGARGRDGSDGSVRRWHNGNLQAYVEPSEGGYRLRLRTTKCDAASTNRLGIGGIAMGAVLFGVAVLSGDPGGAMSGAVALSGMGAATLVYNTHRLPRWALTREAQMEYIASRALTLTGGAPASSDEPS
jgi:hypothetical protein